jgi:hypothetical protein
MRAIAQCEPYPNEAEALLYTFHCASKVSHRIIILLRVRDDITFCELLIMGVLNVISRTFSIAGRRRRQGYRRNHVFETVQ